MMAEIVSADSYADVVATSDAVERVVKSTARFMGS